MPRDIREILNETTAHDLELPKNHKQRFEQRLDTLQKSNKRSSFFFLKIAASLVVLVGLGYAVLNGVTPDVNTGGPEQPAATFSSLSAISPEMQKVENYYMSAINYELASLEKTPENQQLLDDYLEKIGKLDNDYKRLNESLATEGINEKTIKSLITNLQLRLQLLLQLKDQLNELQTRNDIKNENATI